MATTCPMDKINVNTREDVEHTETDLEAVVTTQTEEGLMVVNVDSVVEGIETRGKEE